MKTSFFSRAAILLASMLPVMASAATVTVSVSTPTNNSTVSSPTTVSATAKTKGNITGWRIYVDGVSQYSAGATKNITASISMTAGSHQIVTRAWASDGSYGTVTSNVTVKGAAAAQGAVSPASLTFGNVPVGSTSATQAVTLRNNGTANLTVNGASVSSSQFALTGPLSTSIAPGGSATYNVAYKPTSSGSATGTITFNTNSSTSISPVTLAGTTGTSSGGTTDCTLYASATGSDSNSGTSPSSPKTFQGAANAAMPGAVICVKAGTYTRSSSFRPPRSGNASAWITYKAYGDGPVNFVWTGSVDGGPMFYFYGSPFPSGPAYLEFRGFNIDGRNAGNHGFFCRGSHHLRFVNNYIKNMGESGIASVGCDYLTSDHNLIYHSGYVHGWTSGISYNGTGFFDSYAGFHNVVSNNIISGEYDGSSYHTDGNGITMDLSFNRTAGVTNANTPPTLILNNVVYQNGGRCIINNTVSNIWVVNNTCYKNNLDTAISGGIAGNIADQASKNNWYVNNVAVSWKSTNPAYEVISGATGSRWYKNMYWVGGLRGIASPDPNQFFNSDPLFMAPPSVNSTALGQYQSAIDPKSLGNALELQGGSPAMNKGVDPTTLPNVPSAILTDLKKYIYKDIKGTSRTQGSSFDLGAYSY